MKVDSTGAHGMNGKADETLPRSDRRQAWREIARRVGGRFEEGQRDGQDRVSLEHGPWTVTLDTYTVHTGQVSVTYTRVRAFFIGRGDFKLVVRKRRVLDRLVEALGFGGVPPGDREITRRWVIKGKPASRLRSLLTQELIATLLVQPALRLDVKRAPRKQRKTMGAEARVATAQTTGVIVDPERLAGLFAVVTQTLDSLRRIGMAT
jgi:hypothetical protein